MPPPEFVVDGGAETRAVVRLIMRQEKMPMKISVWLLMQGLRLDEHVEGKSKDSVLTVQVAGGGGGLLCRRWVGRGGLCRGMGARGDSAGGESTTP